MIIFPVLPSTNSINQITPGTSNKVCIGSDGSVAVIGAVTVVNGGTFAVQSTQSGVWNVGSISNIGGTVTIASVPAGSNLIGKVGIDQTTPGTTNKVSIGTDGSVSVIGSIPVTGTFYQTTQPVSLSSLPALASGSNVIGAVTQSGTWSITNVSGTVSLPTGASTAAKQPAIGTAGTAASDVLTIQGIASMTAVKVDGSGVTQPVSIASPPDSLARPGWSFANITGSATTTVKSGAGVMHQLIINKGVATGSITLYDSTTGSGTKIGTIGFGLALLSDPPVGHAYDISFSTGLTIVTSGLGMDLTIAYR